MATFDWVSGLRGRVGPVRENLNVLEWSRFVSERFILLPAATFLPLRAAMAVAGVIGAYDSVLPGRASRMVLDEMHASTGFSGASLSRAARERRTMYRRDLVWRQRMRKGRERLVDWRASETNAEGVHALLAEGASFVVAGGHFLAGAGDVRHLILPLQGSSVGGPITGL